MSSIRNATLNKFGTLQAPATNGIINFGPPKWAALLDLSVFCPCSEIYTLQLQMLVAHIQQIVVLDCMNK